MAGPSSRGWLPWFRGTVLVAVAALNLAGNTDIASPPRFDGAGYAVLARSLVTGEGYREIDHPERPRHAHFPPGYPVVLAVLWSGSGPSIVSAHILSCLLTVGAVLLIWHWFGTLYSPSVAWLLGLALASNWRWGRDGGAIRSEPLFLLLSALALLTTGWVGKRGGWGRAVGLGAILGTATLTRHVGIALIGAVTLDVWLRGRRREAVLAALVATGMLLPWVAWLASVGHDTQVGLLPRSGLIRLVGEQALFYARRVPDQLTGPVVEVGTVFRPSLRVPMTAWGLAATSLVVLGWGLCLRAPRRRLAGLVPGVTIPILLVWPFTEAGRFLIPLIPFVLVGAAEGLSRPLSRIGVRRARTWAAAALLAASIPYTLYAVLSDRAGAERRLQEGFDAACSWIGCCAPAPGPILTRHPGEVFLQTGRHALAPPEDNPAAISALIDRYGIAYLLTDGRRYANAPVDPLDGWIAAHPARARRVWSEPGGVAVHAVVPTTVD